MFKDFKYLMTVTNIMKQIKFLLMLLLLFASTLNAQQLNDSTAQIVAYWDLGEKHIFNHINQDIKVEGTDTTIVQTATERFVVEVIDSTANNYILKFTTLESDINMEDSLISQLMTNILNVTNDIPFYVKTDEMGSFLEIVNQDESIRALEIVADSIEAHIDELFLKDCPDSDKPQLREMCKRAITPIRDTNSLQIAVKSILPLFFYHGCKLTVGQVAAFDEQRNTLFSNKPIDTRTEFYLDDMDETHAKIISHTTYNSDQVIDAIKEYAKNFANLKENIPNDPEQPVLFIEEDCETYVQCNIGWVTDIYKQLKVQNGTSQQLKIEVFEVVE